MDDLLGTRILREAPENTGGALDVSPTVDDGPSADGRATAGAKAGDAAPDDKAIRGPATGAGVDLATADDEDRPTADDVPGAVAFVYVPIQPRRPGSDPNTVMFELRSIDGEPGLAVYTRRERLIAELGEHQPHVRIPALHLLVRLGPERVPIAVDPILEPGAERWTKESIRSWQTAAEER